MVFLGSRLTVFRKAQKSEELNQPDDGDDFDFGASTHH
jgi:hypothetical protein